MEEKILGAVGAAAAVIGLALFLRALVQRMKSGVCIGKVTGFSRSAKGWYTAVMEYVADGVTYRESSVAEYAQPVENGTEKVILYDKENPERFCFADANRINMLGFGLLAVIGALMVLRFWMI